MHGIGMQQWGKGRRWKHGGREGKWYGVDKDGT
jgi:hypothetical protein